jgi:uncharacterized protein
MPDHPYHRAPMSAGLPDRVDAWRMVAQRRVYSGSVPLAQMARLRDLIADANGEVRYQIEFGIDEMSVPFVSVTVQAALSLVCQRTLEPFAYPVEAAVRLGLLRNEREESALPPGYEPLLVPADHGLVLLDMIEDELLLLMPVVPLSPRAAGPEEGNLVAGDPQPAIAENPFAALRDWKKH